jgi:hypothetical protein
MEAKLILTITRQSDLDNLNVFLRGTTIRTSVISYIADSSINLDSKEYHDFNYIPNQEFKAFCGQENLSKDGYISICSAYDIIMEYVKGNSLIFHNCIELNDVLSHALKSDKHNILISEIPTTLIGLFKKR